MELMQPPHSISSEQAILGGLLMDSRALDRIEWLEAEHFYREDHRLIFASLKRLIHAGKQPDIVLLSDELAAHGDDAKRTGGPGYLAALVQSTPSAYNIARYAEIVRDKAILRQLARHAADVIDKIQEHGAKPREVAEEAETAFLSILQPVQSEEASSILEALDEALEWADNPIQGEPSGYAALDDIIGGLRPEELIIIAGRPGHGKSSLALGIAEHVAASVPVYLWSGEMSRRQIASRSLSYHRDKLGLEEATAHLSRLKLHIDPHSPMSIAALRMRLRRHKRKHGLGMLVVDYLQMLVGPKSENRTQEVGALSRGLKSMAKEFSIPVVAVASLNRQVENRQNKRPVMSDLRESGNLESDADIVMMVYREREYDKATHWGDLAEIIVRKHREGQTGTAILEWRAKQTRFVDYFGDVPREVELTTPAPRARKARAVENDGKMAAADPDN